VLSLWAADGGVCGPGYSVYCWTVYHQHLQWAAGVLDHQFGITPHEQHVGWKSSGAADRRLWKSPTTHWTRRSVNWWLLQSSQSAARSYMLWLRRTRIACSDCIHELMTLPMCSLTDSLLLITSRASWKTWHVLFRPSPVVHSLHACTCRVWICGWDKTKMQPRH